MNDKKFFPVFYLNIDDWVHGGPVASLRLPGFLIFYDKSTFTDAIRQTTHRREKGPWQTTWKTTKRTGVQSSP